MESTLSQTDPVTTPKKNPLQRFVEGLTSPTRPTRKRPVDPLEKVVWQVTRADGLTVRDLLAGTLCFGASGSGKTSSLMANLMRQMFRNLRGGLVLTASPGDLQLIRAAARDAGREDQLVVIGPDDDNPWVLNPLHSELTNKNRGGGAVPRLVELLMNGMQLFGAEAGNKNAGEKFWVESARKWLSHLIMLDVMAHNGISLLRLLQMIQDGYRSDEEVLDEQRQRGNLVERSLEKAWTRIKLGKSQFDAEELEKTGRFFLKEFPAMADRTRESIAATILGMLAPLTDRPIKHHFQSRSLVHPADCWEKGMIIAVDYPIGQYGEQGRLLQGLILFAFMKALEGREFTNKEEAVFLIVDEVHQFFTPYMTLFQSYARGKGCCSLYATQSLAAFADRLGGGPSALHSVQSFTANFQTTFFLAVDDETAAWGSKRIGEVYDYVHSVSSSQTNQGAGLYSGVSEQLKAKVLPHDLTNLRRGGPPHFYAEAMAVSGRHWSNRSNVLKLKIPQIKVS